MIHAIPFKVVHPCPRPRAVPPRVATTTTTSRRSFLSIPAFPLLHPCAHPPLRRLLPFIPPSHSRSFVRSLARAPMRTHAHSGRHTYTHLYRRTLCLSPSHTLLFSLAQALPLVLSPYWLSIPACNDSMALPHPCAIQ